MFDNWKHKLPTREKIFASRWFKPFAHLFDKPEYWAFKRDKVALSVAIGLFCGMLPAPTQFVSALIMAYFLRTQLPIALFSTLYTNPLTLIPLYVAAYKLGSRLLYGTAAQAELVMPALGEPGFWADAGRWTLQFGQPLDAPIRPAAGRSNSASRWPSAYSSWALPLPSPAMRWCKSSGAGASTASKPGANAGSAEKKAATFNTQMQTKCKQAPSSRHAAAAV